MSELARRDGVAAARDEGRAPWLCGLVDIEHVNPAVSLCGEHAPRLSLKWIAVELDVDHVGQHELRERRRGRELPPVQSHDLDAAPVRNVGQLTRQPEDVLLGTGDVVLVEARNKDFFYTGGLLPAGQRQLPRDYDLDVLEAISLVQGTFVNGAFSGNNFSGVLIAPGLGNPSPSALTVIRRTPSGGQVPIMVDLNRALKDPRERIIIQPDDLLILQETVGEAIARYVSGVFNFSVRSARTSADGFGVSVP